MNIVTGITRLKFSGARTSSANALTRESGASGSWTCAVDFLDLDFLSMVVRSAVQTENFKEFQKCRGEVTKNYFSNNRPIYNIHIYV